MTELPLVYFAVGLGFGLFVGILMTIRDRKKLSRANARIALYRQKVENLERVK